MNSPYSELPPDLSVCPAVPAASPGQRCGTEGNRAALPLPAPDAPSLRRSRYRCLSLGKHQNRAFPQRLPLRAPTPRRSHPRLLAAALPQFPADSKAVTPPLLPRVQLPRSRSALSAPPALPSLRAGRSSFPPLHPSARNRGIAPRLSEDFSSVWDETNPCQC